MKEVLLKESEEVIRRGLPYVETFEALNMVVTSCFGSLLKPDFEESIKVFKEKYLALEITITPKV